MFNVQDREAKMINRETEKQRLFSIIAYRDTTSSREAFQAYTAEYGDIGYGHCRALLVELADNGTIERVKPGVFRRPS